jgi:CheY-like chemotaxis protein
VAKILVADDNSHIQRMVGLVLKDQGIDVVAVGNGEAAVRKISDMRPDLVLADVFMPVRSGYEVCEFVKSDRSLSHIPVILLVGAFDPLDEQEAQRVGADGVLKKPFVPPEPLISMVKSALSRSSVSPIQASAPAIAHEVPPSAAEAPSQDPYPPAPQPVKIPEGSTLLAFGSLLDTPTVAPPQRTTAEEAGDPSFLVARHPSLDEMRDWNAAHTHEADADVAEEDGDSPSGWRRDAVDESLEEQIPAGAVRDWRDAAVASGKKHLEDLPVESIDAVAPASGSSETRPVENSAAPSDLPATEISAVVQEPAAPDRATAGPEPVRVVGAPEESAGGATPPDSGMASPAKLEPFPGTKSDSWFSVSTSPWDAVVRKAKELAENRNLDSTPVLERPGTTATVFHGTDTHTLPPKSTTAIPSAGDRLATPGFEAATPSVADAGETGPAQAPPAALTTDMEALVTQVLAKMSPDLLQNMTRELLKPIVEAIVRGDLDLKK